MDSRRQSQWAVAEAALVWALIFGYIWLWRPLAPYFWIAPLAIVLASQVCRGEMPRALGFGLAGGTAPFRRYGMWTGAAVAALGVVGMAFHAVRDVAPEYALSGLMLYCVWGLFQQYVLNGYFVNRLAGLGRTGAAVLAAAAFAAVHLPNWFLMVATAVGGYLSARVYQRYRSLWFLGLAHGAIGFAIYMFVPDSVTHHLYVGPKYGLWR
jgi:hypothetical protein